jgi:hypothetical protein
MGGLMGGMGRGATGVVGKAFAEYSRALRTTQAALMDPVRWRSDGVLAAVLLLGMFEVSLFVCLWCWGGGGGGGGGG